MPKKPERFDQIRAVLPDVGLAVYAYDPEGPVRVELIGPNGRRTVEGATLADALDQIAKPRSRDTEIDHLFS
ncbi:hypothetical protein IWQ55_000317 [Labrenzia sp. EL_208]|nr:hypothetical protein [Labrenzia sp. EL_132]MBG6227125.1 hypothetical protein [Labrenzia sp. EL_208]